ncbi:PIN domain-containing protein [Opitutaceae bacterium TAV4]|nr:PIN domain-containing protein [Opitutaceae bacterium TAV4]RRK00082.1 PIN domain-containing protein [Opitutaceae bacterium TAV3]
MNVLPDTSFLCALYREQPNSELARAFYEELGEPLSITSALEFEFRTSIELQVFLHAKDRTKGYGEGDAAAMLAAFEGNLALGAVRVVPCDWALVFRHAQRIAEITTRTTGNRAWDVLHVASAVHLGARGFASFDDRQRRLARKHGLKVGP